jgi:hypothetical protein
MKRILCFAFLAFAGLLTAADKPYDFQASEAYRRLSAADRQRLEQVRRDQVLLWGALDMFADEHGGNPPATLDELVPRYLAELPSDPFATPRAAGERGLVGYTPSKGGRGYCYKRGAPGNRAWVIASIGLRGFPYLAERGNVGLYVCKGVWISGVNPVVGSTFKAQGGAPKDGPERPASSSDGSGVGSPR